MPAATPALVPATVLDDDAVGGREAHAARRMEKEVRQRLSAQTIVAL